MYIALLGCRTNGGSSVRTRCNRDLRIGPFVGALLAARLVPTVTLKLVSDLMPRCLRMDNHAHYWRRDQSVAVGEGPSGLSC